MNSKFEARHQHRLDLLGKLGEKTWKN
jgi:hypothetical protein